MQLCAVNFIPLLGSLYMFRLFYTPIIRSTILKTVSTATGTDHSIVSATYSQRACRSDICVYLHVNFKFYVYGSVHHNIFYE